MEKPFFVERLERNDPELLQHMNKLSELVHKDGALPAKVKTLMSMLIDAVLGHAQGVKAIAGQARQLGATEAEIAETVQVAFLAAGMPGLVTGTYAYKED